jgi:hypothetical protein
MFSFGRCDIGCTGLHDGVFVKRKATMRTIASRRCRACALNSHLGMYCCLWM